MKNSAKPFNTIDEYISMFSDNEKAVLAKFREVIHSVAPEAIEAIKYMMPIKKSL